MNSKLGPTLVGMGIALGASLSGCMGQAVSDQDEGDSAAGGDSSDDAAADVDPPQPGHAPAVRESPGGQMTSDEDDDERDPLDQSLAAFCDAAWPPTKGSPEPPRALCVDPEDECAGAPLPSNCFALIEENVCDFEQQFMDPLFCVNGRWECPPGSTEDYVCDQEGCESACHCWGPLPEGMFCGENGPEGMGGAPASN